MTIVLTDSKFVEILNKSGVSSILSDNEIGDVAVLDAIMSDTGNKEEERNLLYVLKE